MISFLMFWYLSGASLGIEVRQSSSDIVAKASDKVQIFCSHDKTDYRMMFWYQQSPGDTAMKLIGFLNYAVVTLEEQYKDHFNITGNLGGDSAKNGSLTIKVKGQEHSAVYYCAANGQGGNSGNEAYFGKGTKLTVLEDDRTVTPPQKPKILEPSEHECKNSKDKKRKKTLVCVASRFYPDHVEVYWQMNEKNVTDGVATDEAAERIETPPVSYRITSRLRVSAKDWFTEGNNFTCIVSFYDGQNTTKHPATIFGVEDKEDRGTGREKYLMITNKAKLSYTVFIFKSCLYGAFVGFLVWRLQSSPGKRKK